MANNLWKNLDKMRTIITQHHFKTRFDFKKRNDVGKSGLTRSSFLNYSRVYKQSEINKPKSGYVDTFVKPF